ncbi:MAG: major capsid protein [Abyssibacter sp.]|uniref:major capsid protein n=1 Tax=Abyssibacter sp. TaxID=2320200 RepID=UPI00321B2299
MPDNILDIFGDDAFSVASLTDVVNNRPYRPRQIARSGAFPDRGIDTTTVVIEEVNGKLTLLPTKPRGAPATQNTDGKRKLRSLVVPHIPYARTIMASEIRNLRAVGEVTVESAQRKVNAKLDEMIRDHELTLEHHRLGAAKGIIFDADGSTVIYNLFDEFGVTQQELDMALNTASTNVRGKCQTVLDMIDDALEDDPSEGVVVYCGRTFFSALIDHAKVRDTYLNWSKAADLNKDLRYRGFEFGGLNFVQYRGRGPVSVADGEAHVLPLSTDLDSTYFAPADMVDQPSDVGLPRYSSLHYLPHGKGVEIYTESNPLPLFRKPKALIKLTQTSS